MERPEPEVWIEPAATRVRDPRSGRSVWLAGMVTGGRYEDDALVFEVTFHPEHAEADRAGILEALEVNLRDLGWMIRRPRKTARLRVACGVSRLLTNQMTRRYNSRSVRPETVA